MNVPAIGAQAAGAGDGTRASQTTVDYQSFLRLLVAQLKFQDPTEPMDATQYMAQLASFSQVEQSVQINAKLDGLLQASLLGQAGSIIGRTVTSADGLVSGVASEVRLTAGGIVAVLDDGTAIPITAGVTISE